MIENMIVDSPVGVDIGELKDDIAPLDPDPYLHDTYEWEVSMMEGMCEDEQFGNVGYDQIYNETAWG